MARWLLAHWALTRPVWVVDWDESNAFCNVPREGLQRLLESHPAVDCGEWLARFYASLDVYVVTSFGLVGHYALLHGGAQGDSMGVGPYTLMGVFRTRANRTLAVFGLHPPTGTA